jgi:multidrug efflux pump subunit AcrB
MWLIRTALRRPYTFVVMALLIAIGGVASIRKTPTDIFPNIDIPELRRSAARRDGEAHRQ